MTAGAYANVKPAQVRATLAYLRACQAVRDHHGRRGLPMTSDPAWLLDMAINRKAGWPDDPSLTRGSARPVEGRYPSKASGDAWRHLGQLAAEINTPRLIVRVSQLGEWRRWLLARLPHRFTDPLED